MLLTDGPPESKRQRPAPGHYVMSPGSDAANEQGSDYEDSDSSGRRGGGGAAAAAAAAAYNGDDNSDDEYENYYDDDASDTERFPSRLSGLGCS